MKKRQAKKNAKKNAPQHPTLAALEKNTTTPQLKQIVYTQFMDIYRRAQSEREKKFISSCLRDASYGLMVATPTQTEAIQTLAQKDPVGAALKLSRIGSSAHIERASNNLGRCLLIAISLAAAIAAETRDNRQQRNNIRAIAFSALVGAAYTDRRYRKLPPYPPAINDTQK